MFDNFPKIRSELPEEYRAIYDKHYLENRTGSSNASSLSSKLEKWMHRKVAEDVSGAKMNKTTLEIGAGTLNHLAYETTVREYDVIEPWDHLLKSSNDISRVRNVYKDINDVPTDSRYDRIVSIAAFEHILNLPEVVAKSGLLLSGTGQMRVAIPSEGRFLWKFCQSLSTGLEFRLRYKLDYQVLMRHEHVNSANEIEEVLRYFFAEISSSVFGISKGLSFYQFYKCSKPITKRCRDYLRND
ncbi:MAG: hypothetical protein K8R02_08820 [Anaerohalosphaeraceae bacterium]|nr:hypothetical protein [Anaerohalosphaeraceae bacterium]